MKAKTFAIFLACALVLIFGAGAFVAAHAHGSGYYTVTFNFGDEAPPVHLSQALPQQVADNKMPSPVPAHKPAVR